jgi:hypothetical protein
VTTPDIINGIFEQIGGILIFRNCWMLYKEKRVMGVSIFTTAFFTAWGCWNLYYYPSLNQWASFIGGLSIAVGNGLWVIMAMYYAKKNKEDDNA